MQAALDAVGRARLTPVDMRYFAARDGRPADYCQQQVRTCDIYVAIIGFRYGSPVTGEGVSYTELEFLAASAAGLPRLVFLLAESACPAALADGDTSLVGAFRERLAGAGLLVREFTSSDTLELEVFHALSELAGVSPGWFTDAPAWRAQSWPVPGAGEGPERLGGIQRVPRIWNVPNRNADFTGRAAILGRLHRDLAGDGRAAVLAQALYGLGGVGKTQVTLEYAHRFKSDYDVIWWIPAEQPQAVSLALAELASRLGLQTGDNATEAAAMALDELRCGTAGRWLLIFDNAEEPADLEPFLPDGPGHVIITSRNHAWTHHARQVELDVFTRPESIAHLQQHVPGLDEDSAGKIAAAVGDLPLAVEQAAAWLAETGMPSSMYIERLETQAADALGLSEPFGYAMPVAVTWNLSLQRLRERSPAAVRLLQILAFCSPEPISMILLYSEETVRSLLPYDPALRERLMVGRIIRDVSRFALVKVDQRSNSLQIHRLVQAVIRAQMTQEEQAGARHELHKVLVGARPRQGETDDPSNWATYEIIWPHLDPSMAEECDEPRTRQLLIDWVRYQWKIGEYEACLNLARRLEVTWTQQLGPDDQQTLLLRFHIANVLRSQGRFEEARDLDTEVLQRQQAIFGADHPHALITAGSLAADYRALGDYRKALASDQRTYAAFKEHSGEDCPPTLSAANNLAISYRLVGDYPAARRLDQDTLDRRRLVLPPDHPYTLHTAAILALDMRAEGAFRDSVELLRVTREKYRTVLGDDMIDPLRTATSLAISLRRTGDVAEATRLAQDTYSRYLKRYGPQNPNSLSCALNLANDYAAHGDYNRALDIATEVHASYQETLGSGHPYTLTARNSLIISLRAAGDLTHAIPLAEQTVSAMRDNLGPDHPFSLSCAINLANCLGDALRLPQAESMQRETIKDLQRTRGTRHPDSLACKANLSVTLQRAGAAHEAEQIRAHSLGEFGRVLGADHPDTTLLRNWQYINSEIEPLPWLPAQVAFEWPALGDAGAPDGQAVHPEPRVAKTYPHSATLQRSSKAAHSRTG